MENDIKLMLGQIKRAKVVYVLFITGVELSDGFYTKALKKDLLYLVETYPNEFDIDRFVWKGEEGNLYIN